jgi:hypothetical protein
MVNIFLFHLQSFQYIILPFLVFSGFLLTLKLFDEIFGLFALLLRRLFGLISHKGDLSEGLTDNSELCFKLLHVMATFGEALIYLIRVLLNSGHFLVVFKFGNDI